MIVLPSPVTRLPLSSNGRTMSTLDGDSINGASGRPMGSGHGDFSRPHFRSRNQASGNITIGGLINNRFVAKDHFEPQAEEQTMEEQMERLSPLCVLIVLAEPGLNGTPLLSALRSNFTLVCPSPAQALEVIGRFEPDVVLIDVRVPSPANLMQELKQVVRGSNQLYVALFTETIPVAALHLSGFDFALTLLASTSELKHSLEQVQRRNRFRPMQALHVAR